MPTRRKKSRPHRLSLASTPVIATTATPKALCIVEILEHILSFLSQHVLRNVASLVSRQWYNATCRSLFSEALWASNFQPDKRLEAMNNFPKVQILTLTPDAPERRSLPYMWPNTSHAQRQIAWREVLIRLQNASSNKGLDKVRILDLRGSLDVRVFCRVVEQCLAQQLVVLQLEVLKSGDYYYLERILKGCPRLETLKVERHSELVHGQAIPGSSPEDPGSEHDAVKEAAAVLRERQFIEPLEWTETLKLRTLVLFRPMVSQRVLQAILHKCPDMRVLKLISVIERASYAELKSAASALGQEPTPHQRLHGTSPFDLNTLVHHIAQSCPRLHTFHLSLHSRKINAETLTTILDRLSNVRHWSFVTRDMFAPAILPLLHDKTVLSNRMTTLELRGAGFLNPDRSTSTLSKALHEFLCTSPTLLHLIAPTVTYYTEYLDLNRILVGSKDTHPDTPRADGRFWACRSLKTLHLEIRARYESDTLQHSRVIFGYLSKVCPKLEDLQLRRPYLSFWLAGGLCLLSRLHNLEKIKLCCRSYTGFCESDVLEWVKREGHPWGKVSPHKIAVSSSFMDTARLGCKMAMIKAGLIAAPSPVHPMMSSSLSLSSSPPSYWDSLTITELSVANFVTLGEMKDIEDLQIERMLQYQRQQPCWPRLESFTVVHDGWFNNSTTTGIERLRPDVQFQFETRSFHQNGYQ
ncbi:hypothetical protein BC939DRAFT_70917 [Gamsiella multidivaricata]|uniref:uncharacterized protein n=1 Tax=Gamsiella multidivaricata TaxID=101098 RepID=UPI00221EC958|nr:uncharacterized protein BC939DRAFT_70917 [Gamsiella multidivaricata]KAG0371043.1 hypothetical protein BGZ54_000961 [Gamsiella multidivaricata]KAI7828210.1 hypothetical protein BC939DRAFT_70917 [Gamsiella multidivaricata]